MSDARRLLESADARYSAGEHAAAHALCEQALALYGETAGLDDPDRTHAFYGLGRTLVELGDYARARRALQRVLAGLPAGNALAGLPDDLRARILEGLDDQSEP